MRNTGTSTVVPSSQVCDARAEAGLEPDRQQRDRQVRVEGGAEVGGDVGHRQPPLGR